MFLLYLVGNGKGSVCVNSFGFLVIHEVKMGIKFL